MKRFLGKVGVAASAVLAVVSTAAPVSAAVVVADLGVLPGHGYSQAWSVRDDGVAVGYSTSAGGNQRAVIFRSSGISGLATPGRHSEAVDLTDDGLVVGWAESPAGQWPMPVWWDGSGALHELPGIEGEARGVNEAGVVVGVLNHPGGRSAARWDSTSAEPVRLPTPPGGADDSVAYDVNTEGIAVGYSRGADGARHAVLWDVAGAVRQLDAPAGFPDCHAYRLNDTGDVVGSCFAGTDRVAVRWSVTGSVTVLSTLGTPYTEAVGVSDGGVVVGSAEDTAGLSHAVRWNANGTVTRLAPLGGSHALALDISNSGTVVGYSHLSGSRFHATAWRNAG